MRIRPSLLGVLGPLLVFLIGSGAYAQGAKPEVNSGDTAFVLVAAALVMLMTPGLALFYGGMVRRKNVLATFMQSFIMLGAHQRPVGPVRLQPGLRPRQPRPHRRPGAGSACTASALRARPDYAATIPHQAFMVYQLMFAIITPALISRRLRRADEVLGLPRLHRCSGRPSSMTRWRTGSGATGGWLQKLGALDFAGGTGRPHHLGRLGAVLRAGDGQAAAAIGSEEMHPHNLTMTALGTGLLWFGWFGFNAGSALAANGLGGRRLRRHEHGRRGRRGRVVLIEWIAQGQADRAGRRLRRRRRAGRHHARRRVRHADARHRDRHPGVCAVCYGAIMIKARLGYDDSLDVFGVHGVGGTLGALLTGVFASKLINTPAPTACSRGTRRSWDRRSSACWLPSPTRPWARSSS